MKRKFEIPEIAEIAEHFSLASCTSCEENYDDIETSLDTSW